MCPMLRGCRDGFPLNEDAVMVSHLNPFNLMSIPCAVCPMLRGCRDGFPLNEDAVMVSHLNPFNLMSIPCVLCYEDAVTVSHLMRIRG